MNGGPGKGKGPGAAKGGPPPTPEPPNLAELSEKDVMNVLAIVRKEFNVDDKRTYLMGHSMGGAGALFLGPKYVDQWAELGVRAWADGWWEMPVSVGDEIAPLIGAGAGEVAMVPNVTIGQAAVLSSPQFKHNR